MSAKQSKGILINKKDLQTGLVRKVFRDGLVEYWCYKFEDSGLFDTFGAPILNKKSKYLNVIIVCGSGNHITNDAKACIWVAGVVLRDNKEGNELERYLIRTKRGRD